MINMYKCKKTRWLSILFILLWVCCGSAHAVEYGKVTLPNGASIRIHHNWSILSKGDRVILDDIVALMIKNMGKVKSDSDLQFAANYYDANQRTIGILNARLYPKFKITQEDARKATASDIKGLDKTLEAQLRTPANPISDAVLSWDGTSKTTINGTVYFISSYTRKALTGPGVFNVRLVRLPAGDKSFTLTISYLNNAGQEILKESDAIINSLIFLQNKSNTSVTMRIWDIDNIFSAPFPQKPELMESSTLSEEGSSATYCAFDNDTCCLYSGQYFSNVVSQSAVLNSDEIEDLLKHFIYGSAKGYHGSVDNIILFKEERLYKAKYIIKYKKNDLNVNSYNLACFADCNIFVWGIHEFEGQSNISGQTQFAQNFMNVVKISESSDSIDARRKDNFANNENEPDIIEKYVPQIMAFFLIFIIYMIRGVIKRIKVK